MIRVALIQGFPFHFEMIGFALDYCLSKGWTPVIYVNPCQEFDWWWAFYEQHFGAQSWVHLRCLEPNLFDVLWLLTDDDPVGKLLPREKVLTMDHSNRLRNVNARVRIAVRPFTNGPMWALPIYPVIEQAEKTALLSREQVSVCYVGKLHPTSEKRLRECFVNPGRLTVHIICRKADPHIPLANIVYHEACSATELYAILGASHFIACEPATDAYIQSTMSGALPLAFQTGCRLIINSSWQQQYNFASALVYTDEALELTPALSLDHLDAVYAERDRLMAHRNRVLDTALLELFNAHH